jgi:NhaA family Na+:H+ antiporter
MSIMRSERNAAGFLLAAAAAGLLLANSSAGPLLLDAKDTHLDVPALGISLSLGHWVSDGLLAIFFFIVAVELKHELTRGSLNSVGKAFVPAFAAIGGIAAPAGIYLLVTAGSGLATGWPVPTATDIAFALGVLAIFGRGLPSRVRIFLLALAVLDDLVAILIIAVFFTNHVNFVSLGLAAVALALFALVASARTRGLSRGIRVTLLVLLALVTWYLVLQSGIHATIAGVALGLALPRRAGARAAHILEPYSNGIVLPLFAFAAALVAIPSVGVDRLSPAFWGILIALPVGKLLGITALGLLGQKLAAAASSAGSAAGSAKPLVLPDLLAVAVLGGIGFTVSLLMNELAFAASEEVVDEGTLAVLLGSAISIMLAAILVTLRSRAYRRATARAPLD